ncbi:MAG: hypothetical protein VKM68_00645 [Cyanobacteriota bacterium]|nr:hypothetical protein [Synechococcus sp. Tobar2m-G35]MEB3238700.1 hypothetical protein [Cyanobacteriota bacterium]
MRSPRWFPPSWLTPRWQWYLRAQAGLLLLPLGLCLFGEALVRRAADPPRPWFWIGTLSLLSINAGVGLMVESGLFRGYPRR